MNTLNLERLKEQLKTEKQVNAALTVASKRMSIESGQLLRQLSTLTAENTALLHALAQRDGEVGRLQRCLGFFASCIKSGESWSKTCQKEYDEALSTPATAGREAPAVDGEDTKRLDKLEAVMWGKTVYNGLALFPGTLQATGERIVVIHDMGDEDGSNLGEELSSVSPSLRAAIDSIGTTNPADADGEGDA